jgi:hypothetical protein
MSEDIVGQRIIDSWLRLFVNETVNEERALDVDQTMKKCHGAHFDAIGMGGILEKYIGSMDSFINFLEKEWNWKVTYDKEKKTIMADENKEKCICPLVKEGVITSRKICSCSEGFAERMFSLVLQKEVRAEVVRSYIRDEESCIYKITIQD